MTAEILITIAEQLNIRLTAKSKTKGSSPFIRIGNAPVYSSHAPKQVAPDQIILTLAGFTGTALMNKRTTGFHSTGIPAENELNGLDTKIAFIADFSDENYLTGIRLMEEVFRILYEQPIWELPLEKGEPARKLEIISDIGTRGEAGGFLRAFSGKLLPVISYSIKMIK